MPTSFYDRATPKVARDLLGCRLVVEDEDGLRAVRVVEVEAYLTGDPASHAFRGPTPRNRSMFRGPGTLYVFRIHQVYCANAVTRTAEAVLLRAGEPILPPEGYPVGPGRLCRTLGIDRTKDGANLVHSEIRILPRDGPVGRITVGRRVGIRLARDRRLRFFVAGSRWVSSPRTVPALSRLP